MSGIPGLAVGSYPAAPRPARLLQPGSMLLAAPSHFAGHRAYWGRLPLPALPALIEAVGHIVGGGGAEFPTARKLALMGDRDVAAVVINGMEGEPASAKDTVLLVRAPHLVLDGAVAVAAALGTRKVIVRMAPGLPVEAVRAAIAERRDAQFSISLGPDTFVAGEASAIARALRGGPALPDGNAKPPVVGWRKRPIFLSNVETFARIGAAVRGKTRSSALVTVSGAVATPGVLELPARATIGDVLRIAGASDPVILVTGGWHGSWLPWRDSLTDVPLTREAVSGAGGRWGAGILIVLGRRPHPVHVLDAVADALAAQTAGQCGPCVLGLPELARAIHERKDIEPAAREVTGRGLCAHPTAAAAALRSGVAAVRAVSGAVAV